MHKFNTLKYGGGAVTLLPQHVAQRMVRHVSKQNGWNGVGRFGEEVQGDIFQNMDRIGRFGIFSRRFCKLCCRRQQLCDRTNGIRRNYPIYGRANLYLRSGFHRLVLFRHACGGRNHLLTEVAA